MAGYGESASSPCLTQATGSESAPCPTSPVTDPESALLARFQTLTPWLCMDHGAAPGVALLGTLGSSPRATGATPYTPRLRLCMKRRRFVGCVGCFGERMPEWVKSWSPGIMGFLVSPRISGSQVFSFTRRRHTSDAGSPESGCGPWRGVRKVSVRHTPAIPRFAR